MSRVRVLVAIPNLNGGGAERIALNLAASLDPARFEVRVFVHERWGSLLDTLDPGLDVTFANEGAYRRSHLPRSLIANIRLARHADVVIGANEGRAAFLSILAARLLGKPLVLWLHNDWQRFSQVVSWRQRAALRLYGAANAVVACSRGVADSFAGLLPSAASRIRTIYNGVPLASVRAKAEAPLDPEQAALFADPVIVAVGRLDYQKGHEFLVAAHAELRRRGHWHRLAILGEGGLRGALEDQARALGVADTVHFLGFQANPFRFVRRAAAFALPSRFEGFAIVIAEAAACGVPIVAADCPFGPNELLDGGTYGRLVVPEDADALADALAPVLADPAERSRLADLAAERAPAFDLALSVAQWEQLLLDLTRRSAGDHSRRAPAIRANAS